MASHAYANLPTRLRAENSYLLCGLHIGPENPLYLFHAHLNSLRVPDPFKFLEGCLASHGHWSAPLPQGLVKEYCLASQAELLEEYIGPHFTAHLGCCSAMRAFRPGFLLSYRKEGSKATPLERMEGSFLENMALGTHIRFKEGGRLVENASSWLPPTPDALNYDFWECDSRHTTSSRSSLG